MATRVAPHHFGTDRAERSEGQDLTRYGEAIGRALFALIFLVATPGHFTSQSVQYAAAEGAPLASLTVPLSGLLALAGGLSVLLGYKTRIGALLLVLFLVPVTLLMHDFWTIEDAAMRGMQQVQFMKNIAMLGGALLLGYFGAGPLSLDARMHKRARGREHARER